MLPSIAAVVFFAGEISSVSSFFGSSWGQQQHHLVHLFVPSSLHCARKQSEDSVAETFPQTSPPKRREPKSVGWLEERQEVNSKKNAAFHDLLEELQIDLSTLSSHTQHDSPDQTWAENIVVLKAYKKIYGTVPKRGKNSPKVIGRFLKNCRRQKHTLTARQIEELESVGFSWEARRVLSYKMMWQERCLELKTYQEEHGSWKPPVNTSLGKWTATAQMRYTRHQLSERQVALLNDIGFECKPPRSMRSTDHQDASWLSRYEELKEFHRQHGHCNVPKSRFSDDNRLAAWGHTQRTRHSRGELRKDRHDLLQQLGFPFDYRKAVYWEAWLRKYEEVKKYYHEWELYDEATRSPSEFETYASKPDLSEVARVWMWEQRRLSQKGTFDPKKIALLNDIGFHWSGKTKRRARPVDEQAVSRKTDNI